MHRFCGGGFLHSDVKEMSGLMQLYCYINTKMYVIIYEILVNKSIQGVLSEPSLFCPSSSAQPSTEDCPWLLEGDTVSSLFSSRRASAQQIADDKTRASVLYNIKHQQKTPQSEDWKQGSHGVTALWLSHPCF